MLDYNNYMELLTEKGIDIKHITADFFQTVVVGFIWEIIIIVIDTRVERRAESRNGKW